MSDALPEIARAVIRRPAARCFASFCDALRLRDWLPGLQRARVVTSDEHGFPSEVLFEYGDAWSYALRYTYDPARRRVEWEPITFKRDAVTGFAEARRLVLEALPRLGWTGVAPADGAFYVYAGIANQLGPYADSVAWCAALLAEEDVALTPGVDFDRVHGGEYVRLSLASGPGPVAAAIERILAFQGRLADDQS